MGDATTDERARNEVHQVAIKVETLTELMRAWQGEQSRSTHAIQQMLASQEQRLRAVERWQNEMQGRLPKNLVDASVLEDRYMKLEKRIEHLEARIVELMVKVGKIAALGGGALVVFESVTRLLPLFLKG